MQALVLILSLLSGFRFYMFMGHLLHGGPSAAKPAMVDGFLPIGGLMGLKLWLFTGSFDRVHPAAIIILSAAMLISALFKKSFCSWICPVGACSEALWKTGRKAFEGRDFKMYRPLDYFLRSIKYFLLAFFLYMMSSMSSWDLAAFLNGPYWVAADARMLWFFENLSAITGLVLTGLLAGSFFYKNFWCRYFCPYGAFLGILSFLSLAKITRDEDACIHCGACNRNCPAYIEVDSKYRIKTPECSGCLSCVANCPAPGALGMRLAKFPRNQRNSSRGRPIPLFLYAALLLVLFFGAIAAAKTAGKWDSYVTYADYQRTVVLMRNSR
ncbi:MAG: 4Fe-4S binding protein [Actinomycetota bacterium]|nr:4Fe-4S binding protein [Actinomycetota bacterium]